MKTDLLLITDTVDNAFTPGYDDLLGISSHFAKYGLTQSKMLIFSQLPLELKLPETYSCNIEYVNIHHPDLIHPHPVFMSRFIHEWIQDYKPTFIALPNTMRGCQVAANLSCYLNANVIAGIDSVFYNNGDIHFNRSILNGKGVVQLKPTTTPCIITINQGAFTSKDAMLESSDTTSVKTIFIDGPLEEYSLDLLTSVSTDNRIDNADVIVAAGRGIGKKENLELITEFTTLFTNAAIGASRPLCDSGLLPYSHQIGETGKQVAPKLYIACGISGANQHINGIKQAQTIVAINSDPQAAIFNVADVGIVENLDEFIPILIKHVNEMKKS